MLAAENSSSGQGNGGHQWLSRLIGDVQNLTQEIRQVTGRIQLENPASNDIVKARNLVKQLLALIEDRIIPRQADIREIASASGPTPNITKELRDLRKSGREALSAISVYEGTLGNEYRQRQGERRSNPRYSVDQKSLHKLHYEAFDKVDDLLEASKSFL